MPFDSDCVASRGPARISRAHFDGSLITALRKAHRELANHGISAVRREALDQARGLPDPYLRRIASLAFLAPDIQQSILAGRQPAGLSLKRLTQIELPLDWSEQRLRLGFTQTRENAMSA